MIKEISKIKSFRGKIKSFKSKSIKIIPYYEINKDIKIIGIGKPSKLKEYSSYFCFTLGIFTFPLPFPSTFPLFLFGLSLNPISFFKLKLKFERKLRKFKHKLSYNFLLFIKLRLTKGYFNK